MIFYLKRVLLVIVALLFWMKPLLIWPLSS